MTLPVLRIKYREDWGARDPAWEETLNREPATKVFFHHHANLYGWRNNFSNEVMKILQLTQTRNIDHYGLADIAYHFYVAADGYVYEGRSLKYNSPYKLRYNPECYGNRIDICFLGDYLEKRIPFMLQSMAKLTVDHCIEQGKLDASHETKKVFDKDENPLLQKLHHYFRRINGKRGKWKLHDAFHTSMYDKVMPEDPGYKIRPYHKGKHFNRRTDRRYKLPKRKDRGTYKEVKGRKIYIVDDDDKPKFKMTQAGFLCAELCVKQGKLHKLFTYTKVYDKLEDYYKRID